MSIPIFADEKILRAYFSEVLKRNFDETSIEEIICYSKTYSYAYFRGTYLLSEASRKVALNLEELKIMWKTMQN